MNRPLPRADLDWPVTGRLWAHQRGALQRSASLAAYAFSHDPGLGKTATVIAEAGRMFLDGTIDTLVVIAPNRVHEQWLSKAFPQWAAYRWHGMVWPKGGLSSGKRLLEADQALQLPVLRPRLRVFTFNFEAIRLPPRARVMPPALQFLERVHETSQRGIYACVDEIHRCKDPRSQQTRSVLKLGRGWAKVRRALTGTPILQGVEDLWSQYAFLDPRIIGEQNFWSYRARYCKLAAVPGRPNAARIVGHRNTDQLMARIAPHTSRVLDSDVLDMPPKNFDVFEVGMEPKQARAYAQMEDLMVAGLRGEDGSAAVITARIVLTQLLRLQELSSGFIREADGTVHWLSDGKIEAIREWVADLGGEPVVIWAPFIPLLERLTDALGAVRFRDLEDIDAWRRKGGPLVANPASGGVGVDGMQFAHRAGYAANSFSGEHRVQSVKRIHRGDQKLPCFYMDFLTRGSKDAKVLRAVSQKLEIGHLTVDKLKEILL